MFLYNEDYAIMADQLFILLTTSDLGTRNAARPARGMNAPVVPFLPIPEESRRIYIFCRNIFGGH